MDAPATSNLAHTPSFGSSTAGGPGSGRFSSSSDPAFRALRPLDLQTQESRDALVPLDPSVLHGHLHNGLAYYVKKNPKPKDRAALALVVNVGSLVEEEGERGVAHIVEHLAFSATKKYSNHDIVKFLESIGAEFGACQNAYTSADETVYELLVPVDKPGILEEAVSVLAEFACDIRCSEEDLAKERGAVMEEWRERRNARGRMMEAHWKLLLGGSKYAERLPIGTEQVIKNVPSSTVLGFYNKWYRPNNMAVVAVGDFPQEAQDVLSLITRSFGSIGAEGDSSEGANDGSKGAPGEPTGAPEQALAPVPEEPTGPRDSEVEGTLAYPVPRMLIPEEPFVSHSEPRLSALVEREGDGSAVVLSCKLPVAPMDRVRDYRAFLVEQMFHQALSQRMFAVAHRPHPPFYSCSSASETVTRTTRTFSLSASCPAGGPLKALEALWTEVKRVQLHGITEREMARVRLQYLSEMESAFVERDQAYSDGLREEYVEHFLRGDPAPGIDYEARLAKALIPEISASEVSALAQTYSLGHSCVAKILEPRGTATVDGMRAALARVEEAAKEGSIAPWEEEPLPEKLLEKEPEEGTVVQERSFPEFAATEMVLSNGMRVCYKCTDFLDDQVLISGYAYGGLSEVPEKDYFSCALAQSIVEEVGVFGHKPTILMEMLAGKRVEASMRIGTYMRVFSGDTSPSDLETALQLLHLLFTTRPVASESDMRLILQMTREAIAGQQRDPMTAFATRVSELNYGKSRFFRGIKPGNLSQVDPVRACAYFDCCFRDPSEFTVVVVGKVSPESLVPLVRKYLGGIPRPGRGDFEFPVGFQREQLTPVPVEFPGRTTREEVQRRMQEDQSVTQITFPVLIPAGPLAVEEVTRLGFLCKLMETRVMRTLRFQHGQIYSVSVSPSFAHSRPTRDDVFKGDVAVSFSSDPASTAQLIDITLSEIQKLQGLGALESTKQGLWGWALPIVSPAGGNASPALPSQPAAVQGDGAPRAANGDADAEAASPMLLAPAPPPEGLEAADVASVLEIEQRAWETGQHENGFWLDRLMRGYQSRLYSGDVYKSHELQEQIRLKIRGELTPVSMTSAFCRLLPKPCTALYTAVSLVPLAPFWRRLLSLPPKRRPGLTVESKVALGLVGVAISAGMMWRYLSAGGAGATKPSA